MRYAERERERSEGLCLCHKINKIIHIVHFYGVGVGDMRGGNMCGEMIGLSRKSSTQWALGHWRRWGNG